MHSLHLLRVALQVAEPWPAHWHAAAYTLAALVGRLLAEPDQRWLVVFLIAEYLRTLLADQQLAGTNACAPAGQLIQLKAFNVGSGHWRTRRRKNKEGYWSPACAQKAKRPSVTGVLWLEPGLLAVDLFRQPGDQPRELVGNYQQQDLDQDKRQHTLIDGAGRHRRRRDPAQVEQRKAERRGEEGCLQVQRDHHAEPHWVQAHGQQHRADNRYHHEGDLDKVEDKAEQEDHHHHQEERAEHAARQLGKDVLDHRLAAESAEHQGEQRGADQDEEHHGADFGGAVGHFAQLAEVQLALVEGQQHGAECSGFGRGGVASEDRAEYRTDQQQRRYQGVDQLAPFDRAQLFLRQGGELLRLHDPHADDVEEVHAHKHRS